MILKRKYLFNVDEGLDKDLLDFVKFIIALINQDGEKFEYLSHC